MRRNGIFTLLVNERDEERMKREIVYEKGMRCDKGQRIGIGREGGDSE